MMAVRQFRLRKFTHHKHSRPQKGPATATFGAPVNGPDFLYSGAMDRLDRPQKNGPRARILQAICPANELRRARRHIACRTVSQS